MEELEVVVGWILFGGAFAGIALFAGVRWYLDRLSAEKAHHDQQRRGAEPTGRMLDGIVTELVDDIAVVTIDVEDGTAELHIPIEGMFVGRHVFVREYNDGRWVVTYPAPWEKRT